MNNPLVSLIVPLYNRAPLIGETIDSLNKQSYNNIEVIIIDDGSTDNSFDVAFSFMVQDKKIKVVRRPSNLSKGANSCRNFGLSLASGRYIKWIDSDDLLSPTAIEVQVNNLMNTNADVSICKALKFVQKEKNGEKVFLSEWGKIDTFPSIDNFCNYQFIWHTCAGLWDSSFLKKGLFWDEELKNSQEWLFHLQSIVVGVKVSVLNDFLVNIRVHGDSMSDKSNKEGIYYYHECLARYKAAKLLVSNNYLNSKVYKKLLKKISWYHLFVFYKGSFMAGIKTFAFYPIFIFRLLKLKQ